MKKTIISILALVCLLTACSAEKTPAAPAPTQHTTTQTATENTPAPTAAPTVAPNVVIPLPGTVDLSHLDNCTVAVSLAQGDAYLDDTGMMQMQVTVYDYECFDMVDIAQLAVGDVIVLHGQAVTISQLERSETGSILINGGLDLGGHELVSREDTVYSETNYNDRKFFLEVGNVSIPVSPDFVFTDTSNLDVGAVLFYPGDFLIDDPGITYPFTPYNTTITIENGKVIAMERVYIP